jgi:hypothetical protein
MLHGRQMFGKEQLWSSCQWVIAVCVFIARVHRKCAFFLFSDKCNSDLFATSPQPPPPQRRGVPGSLPTQ